MPGDQMIPILRPLGGSSPLAGLNALDTMARAAAVHPVLAGMDEPKPPELKPIEIAPDPVDAAGDRGASLLRDINRKLHSVDLTRATVRQGDTILTGHSTVIGTSLTDPGMISLDLTRAALMPLDSTRNGTIASLALIPPISPTSIVGIGIAFPKWPCDWPWFASLVSAAFAMLDKPETEWQGYDLLIALAVMCPDQVFPGIEQVEWNGSDNAKSLMRQLQSEDFPCALAMNLLDQAQKAVLNPSGPLNAASASKLLEAAKLAARCLPKEGAGEGRGFANRLGARGYGAEYTMNDLLKLKDYLGAAAKSRKERR